MHARLPVADSKLEQKTIDPIQVKEELIAFFREEDKKEKIDKMTNRMTTIGHVSQLSKSDIFIVEKKVETVTFTSEEKKYIFHELTLYQVRYIDGVFNFQTLEVRPLFINEKIKYIYATETVVILSSFDELDDEKCCENLSFYNVTADMGFCFVGTKKYNEAIQIFPIVNSNLFLIEKNSPYLSLTTLHLCYAPNMGANVVDLLMRDSIVRLGRCIRTQSQIYQTETGLIFVRVDEKSVNVYDFNAHAAYRLNFHSLQPEQDIVELKKLYQIAKTSTKPILNWKAAYQEIFLNHQEEIIRRQEELHIFLPKDITQLVLDYTGVFRLFSHPTSLARQSPLSAGNPVTVVLKKLNQLIKINNAQDHGGILLNLKEKLLLQTEKTYREIKFDMQREFPALLTSKTGFLSCFFAEKESELNKQVNHMLDECIQLDDQSKLEPSKAIKKIL